MRPVDPEQHLPYKETDLTQLLAEFHARFKRLSPEQKPFVLREQAVDFAFNRLTCAGRRPYLTRGLVEEVYNKVYFNGAN